MSRPRPIRTRLPFLLMLAVSLAWLAPARAADDAAQDAFSHPAAGLGVDGRLEFDIGRALFGRVWQPVTAAEAAADGLGPLFNARSCRACHVNDGRGRPPDANRMDDGSAVSMVLRLSIPPEEGAPRASAGLTRDSATPEPVYGLQLQDRAIAGYRPEGRIAVSYTEKKVTLAGGETVRLRAPRYRIVDAGYGALDARTVTSPRVAQQMIGLGLLEAIPEAAIAALADPDDADGDDISGRAARVWSRERETMTLGRFGWKASVPSVLQQTAEAFATDIGISSALVPSPAGDCTARQTKCAGAPEGGSGEAHEIAPELLGYVARYARNLAVPERRDAGSSEVRKGEALFAEAGCARCHTPAFTTGAHPHEPHLANRTIRPYTDLLLHDMGDALADGRPEGDATGKEWRTAPLWGIGLTQAVSGHTMFLHDGRARSLTEAILWHGGEARRARDAFAALSRADRARLLAFVNAL